MNRFGSALFVLLLAPGCSSGGEQQPAEGVPLYASPLADLAEEQERALCDSLIALDEEQGLSRAEMCTLISSTRGTCDSNTLRECEETLVIERLRYCPFDTVVAADCPVSASDVATCMLDKIDFIDAARPITCDTTAGDEEPVTCDEAEERCPGLLFPSYKIVSY